jgi:hypothetical protein
MEVVVTPEGFMCAIATSMVIGALAGFAPIMIFICLSNAFNEMDRYDEGSATSFLGATFWSAAIAVFFHWIGSFGAPSPVGILTLVSYGFALLWLFAAVHRFRRSIRPSYLHGF